MTKERWTVRSQEAGGPLRELVYPRREAAVTAFARMVVDAQEHAKAWTGELWDREGVLVGQEVVEKEGQSAPGLEPIVKACRCGVLYTLAQWCQLPDPMVYRVEREHERDREAPDLIDGGLIEVHEQRQCLSCGSHIVRVVPREALGHGEHVGTVLTGVDGDVEWVWVDVRMGTVEIGGGREVLGLSREAAEQLGAMLLRAARYAAGR